MRTSPPLRRALLVAGLLLATSLVALAPAGTAAGTLLVGYAPGAAVPASIAAIGDVISSDASLGIAELRVDDITGATARLASDPSVQFVETDGAVHASADGLVHASSASWDSSRWESSRWDSSRWDSSRWDSLILDSSRWDSSRWDSSRWDSSRWDSSRWDGSAFALDPLFRYQWGLADMNVPAAWYTDMGHMRKTLCVVDSGVDYTHPDLAPQMWSAPDGSHGWNFIAGTNDPMDDAGHGTAMAGIAAAAVGNGIGTAGVVNARIMAVKVLDSTGTGTEADLASGIAWCADHGANVISMSLSTTLDSKAVKRAVDHAHEAGALLVASGGNVYPGSTGKVFPAAYDDVLGVGAIDMSRHHAAFSRTGDWVDVVAPGELIAAPFLGGDYVLGTGTSESTALTAGVALLGWDQQPSLHADELEQKLLKTSQRTLDGEKEPDAAALLASLH
jgi:hypothetical protein